MKDSGRIFYLFLFIMSVQVAVSLCVILIHLWLFYIAGLVCWCCFLGFFPSFAFKGKFSV